MQGCNNCKLKRYLPAMRIVISAATSSEWMPTFKQMDAYQSNESNANRISFHQTGVGMLSSSVSLTKLIAEEKPDLLIQVGIAGSFDNTFSLGKVVVVSDEYLGNTGVEENGTWKDIFDLNLENPDQLPFKEKKLPNPWLHHFNSLKLPEVTAITVNEITTQPARINTLKLKYNPILESMEGAALHYAAALFNTPFIQIRAISNYVGERDKSNWLMKESINNLNNSLFLYLANFF